MVLKKITLSLILLGICLGFSTPSKAITFSSDLKRNLLSTEQETSDFVRAHESAEKKLSSNKNHEILDAIKFYDKNFKEILKLKKINSDHLQILFKHLQSESVNIRSAATIFFNKHIGSLIQYDILDKYILKKYSGKLYESNEDYIVFLTIIQAMIKNGLMSDDMISSEYGFNLVDGLSHDNKLISDLSSSILAKYGSDLSNKDLIKKRHVTRYTTLINDIPQSSFTEYFNIFINNFDLWISKGLINRNDIRNLLSQITKASDNTAENLYKFISKDSTIASLSRIGVFDRAWALQLKNNITQGKLGSKQRSLYLMSYFTQSFIKAKALNESDFVDIWNAIESDINSFNDPYTMIKLNFKTFEQLKWFGEFDYKKLLSDFDKKSANSQRRLLSLIDTLYDWLRIRNWIDNESLTRFLLWDKSKNKKLELEKLVFIDNHSKELITNQLFKRDELSQFFKKLDRQDIEIFDHALRIFDKGFEDWHEQGVLSKNDFKTLFESLNSNAFRTGKILSVMNMHFDSTVDLYDKELIDILAELAQMGNPKVADPARAIFIDNYELLSKKKLISAKTRRILVEEELIEMNKSKKRRSKKVEL